MILAIIHHKGGSGKTTSAVNLVGEVIKKGWAAWSRK